ncbi:MAG: hypothetical protein IJG23_03760, partial [Clostridia bacterium]|nr:hypothetical protein [Clostridia bacterium]
IENAEMCFNKALQACLCGSIIARNENAVELAKKSKREAIWVRFPSGRQERFLKCKGMNI